MSEFAVKVRNIGKAYSISPSHKSKWDNMLREDVMKWVKKPFRRRGYSKQEMVWSLKDVSFDIRPGEIVGIIGRNGAGKSTLLKLISRVTEPTSGRIDLFGRVGALLEVGTGFHAELSGRENIFLSGTILGMTRKEIQQRFDEIVDYAGVESYLETPIKRYSSGMFLRLAFSVMAHLRADILIIDEVLAVGDAAFQEKCLGTIAKIAENGRTVLFVSHQMESIATLCSRVILLGSGSKIMEGDPREVIDYYYSMLRKEHTEALKHRTDRKGRGRFRFIDAWIESGKEQRTNILHSGRGYRFVLTYEVCCEEDITDLAIGITIMSPMNQHITEFNLKNLGQCFTFSGKTTGRLYCEISKLALNSGLFHYDLTASYNRVGGDVEDHIMHAGALTIEPGQFYENGAIPSKEIFVLMEHSWDHVPKEEMSVL